MTTKVKNRIADAVNGSAHPENGEDVAQAPTIVRLKPLVRQTTTFYVQGVTQLVPHRWDEKALRMIREKQGSLSAAVGNKRAPKKPTEEAVAACYWMDPSGVSVDTKTWKRPAMPARAFKAAIVGAVRSFENITLVQAKTLIFVNGEGPEDLVEIHGKPEFFEQPVRIGMNGTDLRYRMRILPWWAKISVSFYPHLIDIESIAALVDFGGSLGIGDGRPSSPKSLSGTWGTWKLVEREPS